MIHVEVNAMTARNSALLLEYAMSMSSTPAVETSFAAIRAQSPVVSVMNALEGVELRADKDAPINLVLKAVQPPVHHVWNLVLGHALTSSVQYLVER